MQKIGAYILTIIYITLVIVSIYNCYIGFSYPIKYKNTVTDVCSKFDIPKSLFYALIKTESNFNPNAKSSAGAIGLTQVLPTTAQYICVKNNLNYSSFDLYNPEDNLYIGAMYLDYLFNRFENKYTAICAYNAGETVVRNWLKDTRYSYDKISLYNIPYNETNNYINKIKNNQKVYIKFYGL